MMLLISNGIFMYDLDISYSNLEIKAQELQKLYTFLFISSNKGDIFLTDLVLIEIKNFVAFVRYQIRKIIAYLLSSALSHMKESDE